jgi:hypothetical protein
MNNREWTVLQIDSYRGEVSRDIIQSWSGYGMYDYYEE